MKKFIVALTLLALVALPAAAMAAAEFSLGGYIKLDTWWDSTQVGKNLNTPVYRDNNFDNHHGRYQATAQSSRFNFTIKGPDLFGAKTSGFIEVDFDQQGDTRQSASNSFVPRMRHAFFRLDWPETQILFGQYWGTFCDFYPESVQDGPYQFHGCATQRLAQVRVTQKFAGDWTVAFLVGAPYDPAATDNATINAVPSGLLTSATTPGWVRPSAAADEIQVPAGIPYLAARDNYSGGLFGQRSEMPQFQIQLKYEKDLWGKAAFYGRPRGFTAEVSAGWQRTNYPAGYIVGNTFGPNAYLGNANSLFAGNNVMVENTPVRYQNIGTNRWTLNRQNDTQNLDSWMVQATVFIPILTTKTPNLAGTASATVQFYIGQGLSAFGNGLDSDNSYFGFKGLSVGFPYQFAASTLWPQPLTLLNDFNRKLQKRYGGYIQAQYYFSNEWYLNFVYGFSKAWGVDVNDRNLLLVANNFSQAIYGVGNTSAGFSNFWGNTYLSNQDQTKFWHEFNLALYYRPIQAMKFGLQYSYMRTDYFQYTGAAFAQPSAVVPPGFPSNGNPGTSLYGTASSRISNKGDNHRVEFGAWFYF